MMRTTVTKKNGPKRRARKPPRKRDSRWSVRSAGELKIVEVPQLARLDWLVHGFSTRVGGVSKFASPIAGAGGKTEPALNLGFTDSDSRESVLENRKRFFRAIGAAKMHAVTMRQIHSDIVHVVAARNADAQAEPPKADALITRERRVLLAVQTADCIPILLADTKRKAVAAIHAGWRGTLQRIAEKTLGRMRMEFGTQPKDVVAALGPGIGGCCYEVGPEVASKFAAKFANAREWFEGPFEAVASGENDPNWLPWLTMKPPGHAPPPLRAHLDLIAANRSILMAAGVPAENVSTSGFCTSCRTNLFFSYRRERTTGRMMAAIGIL
jgi:polyphenol oxidase